MIAELRRIFVLAGSGCLTLVSACESQKPQYQGPYGQEVAQAVPMIEKAVGLKFKSPPKIETRSKEQVREFVTKQFTDTLAMRDIAGQEVTLRGRFSRSEQLRQALAANPEARYSKEELSIADAFEDLPADMKRRLDSGEKTGE